MLRLSQGQLKALAECPRQFQHASLESLVVPPTPDMLAARQWGDRFHLLMQQREMGLAIAPVLAADSELQACLTQLQAAAPELFDPTGEIFRQSEYERSLIHNGYWFTVVYDLLRQWGDRAEIIDWKTYLKPRQAAALQTDWQTRLYLYVLAETSPYAPEQLSMVYWFVRAHNAATDTSEPQQVRLHYSTAHHHQTRQDLTRLTDQLTALLATAAPFPQVPVGSNHCDRCPFAVRCQRGNSPPSPALDLPPWDAIPEVAPLD
ncbi:MAG TPA: PD-(D/E)XK nuclease family protein [Candidatus Obscuribacterales bacterium]